MIKKYEEFYCDNCETKMTHHEYNDKAIRFYISITLPSGSSRCNNGSGTEMRLCEECSKGLGIENLPEYHGYMDSDCKLNRKLNKCKFNILNWFKNKKENKL